MIFTFARGSNNNTAARDKNFITRLKLFGERESSPAMRTGSCNSERRKKKRKEKKRRAEREREKGQHV